MSRGARLSEAGRRARLPEDVSDGPVPTGPVRTCVGCRQRGPRSVLVRVVQVTAGSSALAVVDPGRSLPGRGAWVHPDPRCLELAERRRAFPRALRSGTLDTTPVRDAFEDVRSGILPAARPSSVEMESGLEADGHPMSTRR